MNILIKFNWIQPKVPQPKDLNPDFDSTFPKRKSSVHTSALPVSDSHIELHEYEIYFTWRLHPFSPCFRPPWAHEVNNSNKISIYSNTGLRTSTSTVQLKRSTYRHTFRREELGAFPGHVDLNISKFNFLLELSFGLREVLSQSYPENRNVFPLPRESCSELRKWQ